jgi:hypothetical protein
VAGEEKDFCAFLVVINHFPELRGGLERIVSSIGAGGLLAKRRIWPFISSTSRRRLPSSGEGPLTSRFSAFNAETRAEAAERWHTDVVDCACDKELYWRPAGRISESADRVADIAVLCKPVSEIKGANVPRLDKSFASCTYAVLANQQFFDLGVAAT